MCGVECRRRAFHPNEPAKCLKALIVYTKSALETFQATEFEKIIQKLPSVIEFGSINLLVRATMFCIMRNGAETGNRLMTRPYRIAIMDSVPKIYRGDDEGITDAEKFHDLLQPLNPEAQIDVFFAAEQEFPQRVDDYDGYLLTGSPASVHDGFDWIGRLSELLVEADNNNKRIVASCFGHQLVARTFGGEVGKNENGWVIGNYRLNILHDYEWMRPAATTTALYHFNQERVTRLPDGAQSFAHSDEYDDFAYTLGDNIMCMQGHPEQPLRAMKNFLKSVASEMPAEELRLARKMIDNGEPDAGIWGRWMMRFFLALGD